MRNHDLQPFDPHLQPFGPHESSALAVAQRRLYIHACLDQYFSEMNKNNFREFAIAQLTCFSFFFSVDGTMLVSSMPLPPDINDLNPWARSVHHPASAFEWLMYKLIFTSKMALLLPVLKGLLIAQGVAHAVITARYFFRWRRAKNEPLIIQYTRCMIKNNAAIGLLEPLLSTYVIAFSKHRLFYPDIDQTTGVVFKETALQIAYKAGRFDIVEALVLFGANPKAIFSLSSPELQQAITLRLDHNRHVLAVEIMFNRQLPEDLIGLVSQFFVPQNDSLQALWDRVRLGVQQRYIATQTKGDFAMRNSENEGQTVEMKHLGCKEQAPASRPVLDSEQLQQKKEEAQSIAVKAKGWIEEYLKDFEPRGIWRLIA